MPLSPILLFHLNPALAPGGFTGVDIFFVISGFLITQNIVEARRNDSFRFREFYRRRVLRIFPALAVTVLFSLLAGWFALRPEHFRMLAWSAVSSLFGVSNIYFLHAVDYFNAGALLHPLLHTWSLGVEEQFYLVWPFLLVLLTGGMQKRIVAVLCALVLLLLAVTIAATAAFPSGAFYLMPFRAFEFALGAVTWLLGSRWPPTRLSSWALGITAAGLLFYSFFGLNDLQPWPGALALIPALGTAIFLQTGREAPWRNGLGSLPLRWIGRISYSVYLVHWPVIVFYRAWIVVPPSSTDIAVMLAASLMFGWLLYALVEQVYRVNSRPQDVAVLRLMSAIPPRFEPAIVRAFLVWSLPVIPVMALGLCAAIIYADGFPSRMKRGRVQQAAGELSFAGDICNSASARCVFGDLSAARTVYLIGDSHALNLVYGLDRLLKERGIKGVALYDHGCLFALGTTRFTQGQVDKACRRNVRMAFDAAGGNDDPVILVGAYDEYISQIGDADGSAPLRATGAEYYAWIKGRMRDSLRRLRAHQRTVIMFNRSYNTGIDLAQCAVRYDLNDERCRPAALSAARSQAAPVDDMIAELSREFPKVTVIDPKLAFCSDASCTVSDNGLLFFRDTNHLTNEGSLYLLQQVGAAVMQAVDAQPGAGR